MRPAIVYDGSIRDSGTPFYFRMALCEVLGYDVDWYTEAGEIPEGHNFYLMIDDGRDELTRVPPHPWGYYATDTHLGPESRQAKARQADVVWCAQKPAAEAYRAQGINAKWLPLACSPYHHPTAQELSEREGKPQAEKVYDIAFVGHVQDPHISSRIRYLDALFKAFPNFRYEYGQFHEDMARVYHLARVGINHCVGADRNDGVGDLNMRFFELASLGVPQVCDERMVGLGELGFMPWTHYLPYRDQESALAAVQSGLQAKRQAQEAARRSLELVRASHTYEHRVREMLRDMECLSQSAA